MFEVLFRFRGRGGVGIDFFNLFLDIWVRLVNYYLVCFVRIFFLNI